MAIVSSRPIIFVEFPRRLPLGVLLVAASWWASWFGPNQLRHHSFFTLWLGFILVIDAVVFLRSGDSIFERSRRTFVALFVVSAPLWWGFELANLRLHDWRYVTPGNPGWFQERVESTIFFSIVLPAMFETATFFGTFSFVRNLRRFPVTFTSPNAPRWCAAAGFAMIGFALFLPRYGFPFVWVGPFFVFDALNAHLGQPSLMANARRGRWNTALALALGGLLCGLFWEMWNFRAMPKWTYTLPFFERPKLFEMPVPGYLGYIPFAFELFAAYHLLAWIAPGWLPEMTIVRRASTPPYGDRL